ncbi:MAG: hypothetical protein ABIS86_17635 [Streptosporangiaceae bacterium]
MALLTAVLTAVSTVTGLTAIPAVADASNDGQFAPLWQTPILDTRTGAGTDSGAAGQIPANSSITVQLIGRAGIPDWGVKAVSTTITVHTPAAAGWLAVYPSGESVNVSTAVYTAGETVTAADFTRITPTRRTTLFNHSSSPVHVSISTDGYFINADQPGGKTGYQPVQSSVLYDTRTATGTPARTSPIPAHGAVTIDVNGLNGIASDAGAVALNVVAADQTQAGSLGIHPSDAPESSPVINFVTGEQDSAFTIAQMSGTGKLTIENNSNGTVNVSVSVRGYFNWSGSGGKLQTVPTKVILQTMDGTGVAGGSTAQIPAGGSIIIDATGFTGQNPVDIDAVALAVNVRQPTNAGWVSVFAADQDDPWLSTVSFTPNESNVGFDNAIPSPSGRVKITNHSYGTVHLEVSARGYYIGGGGACARTGGGVTEAEPEDLSCDDGEYVEPDSGDDTGGGIVSVPEDSAGVEADELAARTAKEQFAVSYSNAVVSLESLSEPERLAMAQPAAYSSFVSGHQALATQVVTLSGEQVRIGDGLKAPTYAVMARTANNISTIKQYPQKKASYCGPASGVTIAKALLNRLDNNGPPFPYASLESQALFAKDGWMWTNTDNATDWSRGSYQKAMNKYQGTSRRINTYIGKHKPSLAYLKTAVRLNIDLQVPAAMNGVYFAGSAEVYRQHPNNKTRGHWVAIYGYDKDKVKYVDSVYKSAAVSWSSSLTSGKQWVTWARAKTLATSNGIVW